MEAEELGRPTDVVVPGAPVPEAASPKRFNERSRLIEKAAKAKGRRVVRFGMNSNGHYVYNDLKNLPPIELAEDGYPIAPKKVSLKRRRNFSIEERKVRFVLMYSYSGRNVMLACQEAGILRTIYDDWLMTDAQFMKCLKDAEADIADRLLLRLAQRVGLVPMPKEVKLHDSALFGMVKKQRPDLFAADTGGGEPPQEPEAKIPRPPA